MVLMTTHVVPGTRLERAQSTLITIGPAVVNGGLTTFLALLLLGFSQSHVFVTFFKVSPSNAGIISQCHHGKAPVECGTAGNCIKTHGTASNTLFLLISCWPVSETSLS